MLVLREEITHVNPREGKVLNLMTSVNQPLVAAADRPPELTQAYICSRQLPGGLINVYVMLHLVKSNLRVLYSLEKDLPMELLREAEDEALTFTENMGFLMDAMPLAKMSEAEKLKMMASCPVFQQTAEPTSASAVAESLEDVVEEIDILDEGEAAGEGAGEVSGLNLSEAAPAEAPAAAEEGFGDLNIDSILQRIDGPEVAERETPAPASLLAEEEAEIPAGSKPAPLELEGAPLPANWLRFLSAF